MNLIVSSGKVIEIKAETEKYQDLLVLFNDETVSLTRLYCQLCNKASVHDSVLVNRTARHLYLGTGGFDFVITNLSNPNIDNRDFGHIMKFRYTPLQFGINSIEESLKYQQVEREFTGLNDIPVVVAELHSMLPVFILGVLEYLPKVRIVYIMTDSGTLTADISYNLEKLTENKLLSGVITLGNAYGGNVEAVNIFSALIAAHSLLKADIIFVSCGPGIVGTGSKFGFSGIDQIYILDTVDKLSGKKHLIPRVSFSEKRVRHRGISHHTLTVLQYASSGVGITLPSSIQQINLNATDQLFNNSYIQKHKLSWLSPEPCGKVLSQTAFKINSMGKTFKEDRIFFETAFVAGKKAALE